MAAAWYGGLRPGLLATALSAAITAIFFLAPRIEADGLKPVHVVGIVIFVGTGWLISAGADALRRTREGHRIEAERLRTTLQSIGDGVIVTDAAARIVSLNAVAERLTGWSSDDAAGRALDRSSASSTRTRASRSTIRPGGRCAKASSSASPTTPS